VIQHFPALLLADIGEVIGALVGLIALVLWVIQKIAEANKAVQPRQARPVAQEEGKVMGQQADPLRNQVEEFLRRAGHRQQPAQGVGQPRRPGQPVREIEVLLDDEALKTDRRSVGVPLRPLASSTAPASDPRPARRPVSPRQRKTLAERATERATARSKSIAQQATNLGHRIIAEDQQFDVQLKAKFDHTVGTLAGSTLSEAELVPVAPDTPAAQIAAMLANPDGVRQAIVLNEILNRPPDRW
jgi:hypothetical protein